MHHIAASVGVDRRMQIMWSISAKWDVDCLLFHVNVDVNGDKLLHRRCTRRRGIPIHIQCNAASALSMVGLLWQGTKHCEFSVNQIEKINQKRIKIRIPKKSRNV